MRGPVPVAGTCCAIGIAHAATHADSDATPFRGACVPASRLCTAWPHQFAHPTFSSTTCGQVFSGDALAFLVRHAARFDHDLLAGASAPPSTWAAQIIEAALVREPTSELLWDVRICHEIDAMERSTPSDSADADDAPSASPALLRVFALFERALLPASGLPEVARQGMRRRYLQCACDFAPHVSIIRELHERFGGDGGGPTKRQRTSLGAAAGVSGDGSTAAAPAVAATTAAAPALPSYPSYPHATAADYAYQQAAYSYYAAYQQQAPYPYPYQHAAGYYG